MPAGLSPYGFALGIVILFGGKTAWGAGLCVKYVCSRSEVDQTERLSDKAANDDMTEMGNKRNGLTGLEYESLIDVNY